MRGVLSYFFFFFNDTATTEIYTLSLHDALPIWSTASSSTTSVRRVPSWRAIRCSRPARRPPCGARTVRRSRRTADRKSTRLNSSHSQISYAVFCLKKKNSYKKNDSETHRPQNNV